VSHAIDRQALIAGTQFGLARLASCMYPDDHWCHNPNLKPVAYNPDLSKKLLAEAGYGGDLKIRGYFANTTMGQTIAEAVKGMLAKVGIDWQVELLAPTAVAARMQSLDYDLAQGGWVYIYDPDLMATGLYHPDGGFNFGRSKNDAAIVLIEAGRKEVGLDQPIVVQFAIWIGHFVRGDWGTSIGTGEKVPDMFLHRLPITLELFIGATLWSVAIGIPAGIVGALKRNSAADVFVTTGAILGVSIPAFWEAIVLIYLLAVLMPVFPASGYVPFSEHPLLNLRAMVLPTFVLGTHSGGLLARYLRSSLLEVLGQDYIRAARAKGFTVIGLSWGGLLAGAFFTEVIFAIPGLGRMSVEAIFQKDFPVMQATLIVVSANVLLVNLLVDILYGYLDPRVRVRG
jgi:peptide/nickel transport system permease protein